MLDENTANKRPHVWMVENVIESVREILFRGLARGQKAIVHCALVLKQLLGIAIVQVLVRDQGIAIIEKLRSPPVERRRQIPAGKGAREVRNGALIVRRDRRAVRIAL